MRVILQCRQHTHRRHHGLAGGLLYRLLLGGSQLIAVLPAAAFLVQGREQGGEAVDGGFATAAGGLGTCAVATGRSIAGCTATDLSDIADGIQCADDIVVLHVIDIAGQILGQAVADNGSCIDGIDSVIREGVIIIGNDNVIDDIRHLIGWWVRLWCRRVDHRQADYKTVGLQGSEAACAETERVTAGTGDNEISECCQSGVVAAYRAAATAEIAAAESHAHRCATGRLTAVIEQCNARCRL